MTAFNQKPVPIPPPASQRFENGIAHPSLWLWDSWTTELDGILHLQCLALSRVDADGKAVDPQSRNDYPFHIRHFESSDNGHSWQDKGMFLQPAMQGDGAFARNVWSGAIVARRDKSWISGFTGIRDTDGDRPFLQTICLGEAAGGAPLDPAQITTLSCPLRDYEQIRSAGYYLSPKHLLGAPDGEEGGPILAWRDPFILEADNGRLEVFWSAKASSARPAVAHATVRQQNGQFHIDTLHPPMLLPDDAKFTQAEVPKVYRDQESALWYMLISACDRMNEDQPADEVTKRLRLYKASSIRGPWLPAFDNDGSAVPDAENLFGGSFLRVDFKTGNLLLIAPYSEYAPSDKQLTFAPVKQIALPRRNVSVERSST